MGSATVNEKYAELMHHTQQKRIKIETDYIRDSVSPEGWSDYNAYKMDLNREGTAILMIGSDSWIGINKGRGGSYMFVQIPKDLAEEFLNKANDYEYYLPNR